MWCALLASESPIRNVESQVCTTMGMINEKQARELAEAGVSAYNHNLDTSEEFYSKITSTRRYQDRLDTLETLRRAGISVCAGGIIGLGEEAKDRVGLLRQVCARAGRWGERGSTFPGRQCLFSSEPMPLPLSRSLKATFPSLSPHKP